MKQQTTSGRSVWISGGSSGIGLEMAIAAAESGARLALFSSRRDALAEAARLCMAAGASAVHYHPVDLGDAAAAEKAAQEAFNETGVPDDLVLNAGISQRSAAGETDLAVTRRIMDVNFMGAVTLCHAVLPAMVKNGGGRIGVTSSLTGVFGFPLRSSYAASKHALKGYFETVGLEYASAGISVTLAVPGRIRTPISLRSLKGDGREHGKMDPGQETGMDARACAEIYWKAIRRRRREVVIGGSETLMVMFYRRIPALFRRIASQTSPF